MEKKDLQLLRIVTPGIIFLIMCIVLFFDYGSIKQFMFSEESIIYYLVVVLFGFLYYILKIRKIFMKPALEKIDNNIVNKILDQFGDVHDIKNKREKLFFDPDRGIMNIFYSYIDKDKTLMERKKDVFFNGYILGTVIDFVAISLFLIILYIFYMVFACDIFLIGRFLITSILTIFAWFVLLPLSVKKHMSLSNYQLDFIFQKYKETLCKDIISLIKTKGF